MPLYEYACPVCDHAFEALVRSGADSPACPACGALEVRKLFSVPAAAKVAGSSGGLPICETPSGPVGCGTGACRSGMCGMGG